MVSSYTAPLVSSSPFGGQRFLTFTCEHTMQKISFWIRHVRAELITLGLLVPLALVLGFVLARFPERAEAPKASTVVTPAPSPAESLDASAAPPKSGAPSPTGSSPTLATGSDDSEQITLEIQSPTGVQRYSIETAGEVTVADLLARASKEHGLRFKAKDFGGSLGIFVEALNGVANDESAKRYWILYLNGAKSSAGASSARARPGDRVTWVYEPMTSEE